MFYMDQRECSPLAVTYVMYAVQCKHKNDIFFCHINGRDWKVGLVSVKNQGIWVYLTRPFTCKNMLLIVNKEPHIWPNYWNCWKPMSKRPIGRPKLRWEDDF